MLQPIPYSASQRVAPFVMNIHEHQAKQLFERFNVATTKGAPAQTPAEAEKIATKLNATELVVKAQIHAGGRGKGIFTNGFKGGVKIHRNRLIELPHKIIIDPIVGKRA
jgi:succinyl-CoA synthetase beta subunit